MSRLLGSAVGEELCGAMGIDSGQVSKLVITCVARGAAFIELTKWVTGEDFKGVKQVVEKYTFIKEE